MFPTITIGPLPGLDAAITMPSYLVLRVGFLVIAAALTLRLNARLGIGPGDTLVVFLIGFPAGLLGAHLLAVLETGGYTAIEGGIVNVWRGRSAIFGGILGGTAAAAAYCAWRGIPLRRVLHGAAPAFALGEGMTRIGCFLAGCCYGRPSDSWLALVFPRESPVFSAQVDAKLIDYYQAPLPLPVHPTQLYSALFGMALCALLIVLVRRGRTFTGSAFCLFLFAYGAWRVGLATLRADGGSWLMLGLYSSQIWGLVAMVVAVALAVYWRGSEPVPAVAARRLGHVAPSPSAPSAG